MAAKALGKDVPAIRNRPKPGSGADRPDQKVGWDELSEYPVKGSWRLWGYENGSDEVDLMRDLGKSGSYGLAPVEARWINSWGGEKTAKYALLFHAIDLHAYTAQSDDTPENTFANQIN
jgi:hypothetical protein